MDNPIPRERIIFYKGVIAKGRKELSRIRNRKVRAEKKNDLDKATNFIWNQEQLLIKQEQLLIIGKGI